MWAKTRATKGCWTRALRVRHTRLLRFSLAAPWFCNCRRLCLRCHATRALSSHAWICVCCVLLCVRPLTLTPLCFLSFYLSALFVVVSFRSNIQPQHELPSSSSVVLPVAGVGHQDQTRRSKKQLLYQPQQEKENSFDVYPLLHCFQFLNILLCPLVQHPSRRWHLRRRNTAPLGVA